MDTQNLLIHMFEELGYHREKQIRMKRLSFMGPAPGTYRFDGLYNKFTDYRRGYLTTKSARCFFEFFIDGAEVKVWKSLLHVLTVNLADPTSLDAIKDLISECA